MSVTARVIQGGVCFLRGLQCLIRALRWLLWEFSGARFIFRKVVPEADQNTGNRPPATFFLWLVGIYVALFGIAAQRYENRVDRIETRANGIYAQLGSPRYREALERIPNAQLMTRPPQPYISSPYSIACSLFTFVCPEEFDSETVEALRDVIVSFKSTEANEKRKGLQGIHLRRADLRRADLSGADLSGADLREALLIETYLTGANLAGADLAGADLSEADLSGANLSGANFKAGPYSEEHLDLMYTLFGFVIGLHDPFEAAVSGADVAKAVFEAAGGLNVSDAKGLSQWRLDDACANPDDPPKLPDSLKPPPPCSEDRE